MTTEAKVVKLKLTDLDDVGLLKLQAAYEHKLLDTIQVIQAYENAVDAIQSEAKRRGIKTAKC